jgi:poly(3-hydroxybutyrate) depolymerase
MKNGILLILVGCLASVLCACGNGSGGSAAASPTSSFAFVSRQAVSVSDCPSVTGESPDWCNTYWPPALRGTVYLYTFTETRLVPSTYPILTRTAYVYKPATTLPLVGRHPMLVFLHGGTQTADQVFSLLQFAQLADGRGTQNSLYWAKNTSSCQYSAQGAAAFGLGGRSSIGFVNSSGQECAPALVQYSRPASAGPFYVVYPNGIPDFDGGGNSWEDGRTPSPGQYDAPDPNQPKRDDVGFINALIAEVKSRETAVDDGRVYVAGVSNGGIMTHRLLCNIDNAGYPELGQVAAFAVLVSSMANNLFLGANGVERCPRAGSTFAPLAIFVGYGFPTPNSKGQKFYANCNPYNPSDPRYPNLPACPYAPVSGDDTIPYGTALDV